MVISIRPETEQNSSHPQIDCARGSGNQARNHQSALRLTSMLRSRSCAPHVGLSHPIVRECSGLLRTSGERPCGCAASDHFDKIAPCRVAIPRAAGPRHVGCWNRVGGMRTAINCSALRMSASGFGRVKTILREVLTQNRIRAERRSRMKNSSRPQVRFFCCAQTIVTSVFTQPGSFTSLRARYCYVRSTPMS